MVYDRTCRSRPWLTQAWIVGATLARARGELDASFGAASWEEALEWIVGYGRGLPIAEIQYWGHGKWGKVFIDQEALTSSALDASHGLNPSLQRIRARMDAESRWWFRTCESFGGESGKTFAREWAEFFGCDAAGHTFIIGPWQSGLHNLGPGEIPSWPSEEGIAEGSPASPIRAYWSRPWRARTINCLRMRIPDRLLRRGLPG
jgi:hypothetical protein